MNTFRLLTAVPVLGLATLPYLPAVAQDRTATSIVDAVVRIPSPGASATVIHTEKGKSLLLGCGHAYRGPDRSKRMTLDIRCTHPGPQRNVGITLLAVDYETDLSLVQLNDGPMEAFAPVAARDFRPGPDLLSVGFDDMRLPATVRPATLLGTAGDIAFTRERPWHGRSGGALLDVHSGALIGVVSGYETTGQRRGMYVSHQAIVNFLARQQVRQGRTAPQFPNPVLPWQTLNGGLSTPLPYLCPPNG